MAPSLSFAADTTLAAAPAQHHGCLQPALHLPDGMGAFAIVRDSEGNRVGLHEEG